MDEREAIEIKVALTSLRRVNGDMLRGLFDADAVAKGTDECKYPKAYGTLAGTVSGGYSNLGRVIEILEVLLDEEGLDVD